MTKGPLLTTLAGRLMRHPAAPYHEAAVQAEVDAICGEHGLECVPDPWGNRLITLATAHDRRPLVLAAHMDHPGFEVVKRLGPKKWQLRFQGGVGDPYFRKGVALRLMPEGVPARLGRRIGKDKVFEVGTERTLQPAPEFAVWELEDFATRRGQIHGRACDDLVGVASILATLIELKRRRARVHVIGLITRAEEVGFQGALAAVASGGVPGNALAISLETSREIPPVKMGQGVIIRVGDRASVFDTWATRYLTELAGDLKKRDASFQFQRALMSGGTCEATVFQEYSIQTAAVCVALGNYHNCGAQNRVEAEYVNASDAEGMVRLLAEGALRIHRFDQVTQRLNRRLAKLLREGRRRLRQP